QPACGLHAGNLRQLDIHEDQVRTFFQRCRHACFAVMRLDQLIRRALEEVTHDFAVHRVVLCVEDGLCAHGCASTLTAAGPAPFMPALVAIRSGISKMKVEPLPSSLTAQMRPPCISINFLLMESPSPVPPYS